MNENRNDQLVQETERKMRAKNIIIHGVNEAADGKRVEEEREFVSAFLREIGIGNLPESIVRLGKPDQNKIRPLKLTVMNETEKEGIMSRLSNLKNAEEKFKKISVTEDYTIEERHEIKKWVEKAKEQNQNETSNIIWKVRSNPKNGMRLVRFTKRGGL